MTEDQFFAIAAHHRQTDATRKSLTFITAAQTVLVEGATIAAQAVLVEGATIAAQAVLVEGATIAAAAQHYSLSRNTLRRIVIALTAAHKDFERVYARTARREAMHEAARICETRGHTELAAQLRGMVRVGFNPD